MPRIGIGITTQNRPDMFAECHERITRHAPEGAKIVVVDDASRKRYADADYRFDEVAGIARAKNKCLELLDDCEHIFLFDDDTYPVTNDWWVPYVESDEPHLMYMWYALGGATPVYEDEELTAFLGPAGCMLYVERRVLDRVGGMDPGFGRWGHEHVSWSDRIYNAGLTRFRYADVKVAAEEGYFFARDEHLPGNAQSTVPDSIRCQANVGLYERSKDSDTYIEYREQRDVVLTHLLAGTDPQWGSQFTADYDKVAQLHDSVQGQIDLVVFTTDDLEGPWEGLDEVLVTRNHNPYIERHVRTYQWLRAHPEVRWVWCVDATDVTMLRDPRPYMKPGKLHTGWEPGTLSIPWFDDARHDGVIGHWFRENGALQTLNAGVFGGDRETVLEFLRKLLSAYFSGPHRGNPRYADKLAPMGDMGIFNFIVRTEFADRLVTGPNITTEFKAYRDNGLAFWQHK